MKKIVVVVSILLTSLLVSCVDKEQIVGSSDNVPSSQIDKSIKKVTYECGNNTFPNVTYDPELVMSFKRCDGTESGNNKQAWWVALMWGRFVWARGEILDHTYPCTRTPRFTVNNLISIPNGVHPKLQWDYVVSHQVIVRRIYGSSSTSFPLTNDTSGSLESRTFIDNSMDISTITTDLVYNVSFASFGEESAAASISWTVPPTVTISGPTEISIPRKGLPAISVTWNANITHGQSPFTYNWYRNGTLAGTSSSFTMSFQFCGYDADSNYPLLLTINDSQGRTASYTIDIFEDSFPYNLY